MTFKGVLLDIDNTVYSYKTPHAMGLKAAQGFAQKELAIQWETFSIAYQNARIQIHSELAYTASSHNRLLYFQRTLELLDMHPAIGALEMYEAYWDAFLDSARLQEGVIEWLSLLKKACIPVCLITDLTAHIQHRKITKLGLTTYVRYLVTSEESRMEKPHPYIFLLALNKMRLQPDEVCVVGDNFDKDILGGLRLKISAFWLTEEVQESPLKGVVLIRSFFDLIRHFS